MEESDEVNELISSINVKCKYTKKQPCGGLFIDVDNMDELTRKTYVRTNNTADNYKETYVGTISTNIRIFIRTPIVTISNNFHDIFTKQYPPSWYLLFSRAHEQLTTIAQWLGRVTTLPSPKDVLRPFSLCPLNKVKVVIIETKPFNKLINNNSLANGLAYSTNRGMPLQMATKAIYRELEREYEIHGSKPFETPDHGDLSCWGRRGVLLLNMALTTELSVDNPHKDIWIPFIKVVIEVICKSNPFVVFMLWGRTPEQIKSFVKGKHVSLMASHPAAQSGGKNDRFDGCDHFFKANQLLEKAKLKPINWRVDV